MNIYTSETMLNIAIFFISLSVLLAFIYLYLKLRCHRAKKVRKDSIDNIGVRYENADPLVCAYAREAATSCENIFKLRMSILLEMMSRNLYTDKDKSFEAYDIIMGKVIVANGKEKGKVVVLQQYSEYMDLMSEALNLVKKASSLFPCRKDILEAAVEYYENNKHLLSCYDGQKTIEVLEFPHNTEKESENVK